jgi:hypothetical protein
MDMPMSMHPIATCSHADATDVQGSFEQMTLAMRISGNTPNFHVVLHAGCHRGYVNNLRPIRSGDGGSFPNDDVSSPMS